MDNDKDKLSYGDVMLRKEDIATLQKPNQWLTDQVIAYGIERWRRLGLYESEGEPSYKMEVIDASVTFLICCIGKDFVKQIVVDRSLMDKQYILFVINNEDDVTKVNGGSHWSVLAFERNTRRFYHLDSLSPSENAAKARMLMAFVTPFLINRSIDTGAVLESHKLDLIEHELVPIQQNSYDCGLYALMFIKKIVKFCRIKRRGDVGAVDLSSLDFLDISERRPLSSRHFSTSGFVSRHLVRLKEGPHFIVRLKTFKHVP